MASESEINTGEMADAPPPGTLTLARGLDILRAVGRGATNLNEVAAAADIGKSAAQRMVKLLVQRGFLRSTHGTDFSLGPALIELGFHALYQSPVPVIAKPILEELLFDRMNESIGRGYSDKHYRRHLELMMANPQLQKVYWEKHASRRLKCMQRALQTAKDNGEIRRDVDIDAAMDAIYGVRIIQSVLRGIPVDSPEAIERGRAAFELLWKRHGALTQERPAPRWGVPAVPASRS